MLKTLEKSKSARERRAEINEVRLLIVILFPCFFIAAACRRLVPVGAKTAGSGRRRMSCFEEARRATYSVLPYAMMQ